MGNYCFGYDFCIGCGGLVVCGGGLVVGSGSVCGDRGCFIGSLVLILIYVLPLNQKRF